MKNTFTYGCPLQERSIRLLKVVPGSKLSTLAIKLVEKNLDETEFEALSYVWGNPVERRTIECNGKRFEIGINLYDICNGKQYDADEGIYDFHDFECVSRGIPNPLFNPTWTALFTILGNS